MTAPLHSSANHRSSDRQVVAAILAFLAHLFRHPPNRRVVEQDCLYERLTYTYEIVVSLYMSQLMGKDGFNLDRRQSCQASKRNQATGFSQPITVGTRTNAELASLTGLVIPSLDVQIAEK